MARATQNAGMGMIRELQLCDGSVSTVDLRDVDSVDKVGEGCVLHFCNRELPVEVSDDYRVIAKLWADAISDPRFVGDQIMFHRNDVRVATLGSATSMDEAGVAELEVVSITMSDGCLGVDITHPDYIGIIDFLRKHGLLARKS